MSSHNGSAYMTGNNQAGLQWMEAVRFVLWGFPEITQTFIHREFEEMARLGININVLAGKKVTRAELSGALANIQRRAIFLPSPWIWAPRGFFRGLMMGYPFLKTILWGLTLPHRKFIFRLRMTAMTLAAADCAKRLTGSGTRFLQVHFASYNMEWAMCLSRLTGISIGGTWHAVGIWRDNNLLKEKIAFSRIILTCTKYNAKYLQGLVQGNHNKRKVCLSYHGIDFQTTPKPALFPNQSSPCWVAIGRLIPKKGFHVMIEAAALCRDRGQNIALRIIGEGPEAQRLQNLIREHRLENKVVLAGKLENREVWRALQAAWGLAAPSIRDDKGDLDGIPNVVLEAMAMARPVIGTNLSGIPEAVLEETGMLVPANDAASLANALSALSRDPDRAESMGKAGRAHCVKYFDLRKNVRFMLSSLQQAMPEPIQ